MQDAKPLHYKVICISMYTDDLKHLDTMIEVLKARGLKKANRSSLIRHALLETDLELVDRSNLLPHSAKMRTARKEKRS